MKKVLMYLVLAFVIVAGAHGEDEVEFGKKWLNTRIEDKWGEPTDEVLVLSPISHNGGVGIVMGIQCTGIQFTFNRRPNLVGGEKAGRSRMHRIEMKFDPPGDPDAYSSHESAKGLPVLYMFRQADPADYDVLMESMRTSDSVKMIFPLYGGSKMFEWDLSDASEMISEVEASCTD